MLPNKITYMKFAKVHKVKGHSTNDKMDRSFCELIKSQLDKENNWLKYY